MYKLLAGLKSYLKWQDIQTDSTIFRLHNSFTTVLLLTCSLIITATQYVGHPISCIVNGIPTHVVNTFCWIHSTFTMPDAFRRQAIACYTPKFLWDKFEGGLMRMIVMGLNITICTTEEKYAKKEALLDYLSKHIKRHKMYALRYWLCEVLCFVNIIVQMYIMNRFFDGEFLSYGTRIMQLSDVPQEQRFDPMVYVFPRVTKCIFHKYGSSGSLQKHDSLCILPLNIVNEKTYVFIWFWYMILLFLLAGLIIFRAVIILLPNFRPRLLHARNRMISLETCRILSERLDIGDWWLIYMLGCNLDPMIYKEVMNEFSKDLEPSANK
uniref:Innexin n=2 Tax=Nemorhina TaxID=44051 RepID=A0A1B0AP66_9MUSC